VGKEERIAVVVRVVRVGWWDIVHGGREGKGRERKGKEGKYLWFGYLVLKRSRILVK
jgi:hypothetical protein